MKWPRIPFAEAIGEPLLFKAAWTSLSDPQKVVLSAIYGLPLDEEGKLFWSALNGFAIYDELGYLKDLSGSLPYVAKEYEDITIIAGRRFSKSTISAFIAAYEAICGGHKAFVGHSQDPVVLQVAQDLLTARSNLRQFILPFLEGSPIGKKELGNVKSSVTADQIRLKSALITVGPPSIKLRGQAIAVGLMDELAVWPKDKESSNPDYEVQNAITPAMMQFPFRKIVKISSPWTEEGLLWQAAQQGTWGRFSDKMAPQVLVLRATTAMAQNPAFLPSEMRAYLKQEREKDPDAFRREYLAEFAKSISGFLNADLLRASVDLGVKQRKPKEGIFYVATLDPAFRRDAFAFSIAHLEKGKFVLDVCEAWSGTSAAPLSPRVALGAIASIAKAFGIRMVTSDQYHLESLQALANEFGIIIEPAIMSAPLKANIWGEFQGLLSQGRLSLLDDPELLDQLQKMEKKLTPQGNVSYAGGAAHDDKAMVVALALHKAFQYGEAKEAPKALPFQTVSDQYWSHYRNKQKNEGEHVPWFR